MLLQDPSLPRAKEFRDTSLDGIRSLAILRVILWHGTGWVWTTWVISAVPAMFVISGALLTRSFESHGTWTSLRKRFKRLLPSLWLYCGVVTVLSWRYHLQTSSIWSFFVPLLQPHSMIAGEWFTSALWYIRAYVWVLLLSPLLHRTTSRFGALIPILGCVLSAILAIFSIDRSDTGWIVGDIVLYATCASSGMVWLSRNRPSRRQLTILGVTSVASGLVWLQIRTTTSMVVNNDHVLHLIVGAFWLAVLMSFPRFLSWWSTTRLARYVNSVTLSIYLWHSMVAWFFWQLLPPINPLSLRAMSVVVCTILVMPVVTYLVGPVEILSIHTLKIMTVAPRLLMVTVLWWGIHLPYSQSRINFAQNTLQHPLPPSAAPKIVKLEISQDVKRFINSKNFDGVDWASRETQMQAILNQHDSDRSYGGTRAIVISPDGHVWRGLTTNAKSFSKPSLIGSLTKTFTTTLIMRLVEEGRLQIDAPIGDLGMNFRHQQVTIHQLLTQTSGMPKYKTQSGSVAQGTTVAEVIRYISSRPLRFVPGTQVEYSTTGFAVLGVILEQTTGLRFDQLLRSEITNPLGFSVSTFIGNYGSIGFSTGGISMKMDDLANWTKHYFYTRDVTTKPWSWSIKKTTGLGSHGYCPCENNRFMALGHIGGRTFASVDGDGTVVVIDTVGVLVNENYTDTQTFAQELRLVAGGGINPMYK